MRLGNHADLRGLLGGGRSLAEPVSHSELPVYQGKKKKPGFIFVASFATAAGTPANSTRRTFISGSV
jgi:hypothetical protein